MDAAASTSGNAGALIRRHIAVDTHLSVPIPPRRPAWRPWAGQRIACQIAHASSDQPTLFHRRLDEGTEQGMRIERARFEFGVILHADEPRVVGEFHGLGQYAVG